MLKYLIKFKIVCWLYLARWAFYISSPRFWPVGQFECQYQLDQGDGVGCKFKYKNSKSLRHTFKDEEIFFITNSDKLDHLDHSNHLDHIDNLGHLDHIDNLEPPDHLDHLDHPDHPDHLDYLDHQINLTNLTN